ncbi:hypothetical protein RKD28_006727 [Streptomyces sp. SAI-229]
MTAGRPAANWPHGCGRGRTRGPCPTPSCWPCPAAAPPWPSRSPGHWTPRSTSSSYGRSAPPSTRSSASARWPATGFRSSTRTPCDGWASTRPTSRPSSSANAPSCAAANTRYRQGRPAPELRGRTVVVVDDGLATGSTARAALRALRAQDPGYLVLAVPVGAAEGVALMRSEADEVVCLHEPAAFMAVGQWYEEFDQLTDDDVLDALHQRQSR